MAVGRREERQLKLGELPVPPPPPANWPWNPGPRRVDKAEQGEPRTCRASSQPAVGPGHRQSRAQNFVCGSLWGSWEPVQGNARNWPGCYGVGTPLPPEVWLAIQAWVNGGLGRGSLPWGR